MQIVGAARKVGIFENDRSENTPPNIQVLFRKPLEICNEINSSIIQSNHKHNKNVIVPLDLLID